MRLLLCYSGTPIGYVRLSGGEPAAAFLEALPSYAAVVGVFQAAGDVLRRARFPGDQLRLPPAARQTVLAAEQAVAQLSLATEAGTAVAVERLDFWDDSRASEPPFLLVFWGAAMAPVPARLAPPPASGQDRRPAA